MRLFRVMITIAAVCRSRRGRVAQPVRPSHTGACGRFVSCSVTDPLSWHAPRGHVTPRPLGPLSEISVRDV